MSTPAPNQDAGDKETPQFRWQLEWASEDIGGEAVLTRMITVTWSTTSLSTVGDLTIQLYESPPGTRWVRFEDPSIPPIPYDEFARVFRAAAKDLDWESDS